MMYCPECASILVASSGDMVCPTCGESCYSADEQVDTTRRGAYRGTRWDRNQEEEEGPVATTTMYPASERQLSFITSLLGERVYAEESAANLRAALAAGTVSKSQASATIEFLLAQPKKAEPVVAATGTSVTDAVPAGRYAIEHGGTLKFFKVDKPTEGRWAGFVFVKVQASDDEYPIRNRQTKNEILAEIAKDPQAASARYGHELGSCGICGRTLTDEDSRARGIGPICAGKMGW